MNDDKADAILQDVRAIKASVRSLESAPMQKRPVRTIAVGVFVGAVIVAVLAFIQTVVFTAR